MNGCGSGREVQGVKIPEVREICEKAGKVVERAKQKGKKALYKVAEPQAKYGAELFEKYQREHGTGHVQAALVKLVGLSRI